MQETDRVCQQFWEMLTRFLEDRPVGAPTEAEKILTNAVYTIGHLQSELLSLRSRIQGRELDTR